MRQMALVTLELYFILFHPPPPPLSVYLLLLFFLWLAYSDLQHWWGFQQKWIYEKLLSALANMNLTFIVAVQIFYFSCGIIWIIHLLPPLPSPSPPPSFSSKWRDLQLTEQMIELFSQLESDWFNSKRMDRWNSFVCFIQLLHSFQFDQLNALSYWELIRSLVWLIWNSTLCQFKILKIIQNTWNCSS